MCLVRNHTIGRLHERDYILHQALRIRPRIRCLRTRHDRSIGICRRWRWIRSRSRHLSHRRRWPEPEALRHTLRRIAIRHHHDHRHRFTGRNLVIHNHGRAAHHRPRIFISTTAVQQVEHRILLCLIALIVRWQIKIHAALIHLQRRRGIPDLLQRSMRNILEVPHRRLRPAYHQHAVVTTAIALRLGVRRIERAHAIHHEPVAIHLRCQSNAGAPHPGIVLGHGQVGRSNPATAQRNDVGFGGEQTKRNLMIRCYLWRGDANGRSGHRIWLQLCPGCGGDCQCSHKHQRKKRFHSSPELAVI